MLIQLSYLAIRQGNKSLELYRYAIIIIMVKVWYDKVRGNWDKGGIPCNFWLLITVKTQNLTILPDLVLQLHVSNVQDS